MLSRLVPGPAKWKWPGAALFLARPLSGPMSGPCATYASFSPSPKQTISPKVAASSTFLQNLQMSAAADAVNEAKRAAGYRAVDDHMKPSFRYVGIGSGSTVIFCVERLAQLRDEGKLPVDEMYFVPTGYQSKQLIAEAQLPMMEVDQFSAGEIDIVFDGADEIDDNLQCIKGGGACLFQEKLVGKCSRSWVCVADASKVSSRLGQRWTQGIPIEVVPFAHKKVAIDLNRLGATSVTLRQGGKAKAGPIVTDNGNFVLDAYFGEIPVEEVVELDKKIKLLVGVLETGLFDYATAAYIGMPDGSAQILQRPPGVEPSLFGNGPIRDDERAA